MKLTAIMLNNVSMRVFAVAGLLLTGLASCVADVGDEESETDQEVLAPPTTVSSTATAPDRVTVTWTSVPGAVKYYIYQQTGTTGPIAQINSVLAPGTSLQVAHLTAGTQYCFSVRTVDNTDTPGAFSTSSCGTTQSAPPAPSPIVVEQTTPTKITVRWTAVAMAQKYYVFHSAAVNGSFSYIGTTLAPNTSFVQTVTSGVHCYKVQTQSANGTSAQTAAICNNSLQPPTGVTVVKTGAGRLRVSWTPAMGANRIYGFESRAGGAYSMVTSTLATAGAFFDRAGLTPGVQYCYELQAQYGTATNPAQRSGLTIPVCGTP